jgi:tetratricopeptide (TPR) repeat protein
MRRNEQMTAALLVAALAAFGCSKTGKTSQTETQSQHTEQATPVSMTNVTTGDKGLNTTATKIAGPVSFADGEAAYQAGNFSEATKLFEQYTGDKPRNVWGHFMLGLSASKSGDLAKAETAFEEALRIDPDHIKSLVNLSRVLIEQRRFDDALDKLAQADNIDPKSAEVHRLLGRTYAAVGRIDESIEAYRAAIALNNKDAWSMNNLGLLFLERGCADDALPLLARAVELGKDTAMFHNNLGMALEHTGRFAAAASEYKGAINADPAFEKAKRNLVRVEAVKVDSEEPFNLEETAKGFVEQPQVPVPDTNASR